MPITLDDLRRYAVSRSLFRPTTLKRALNRFGFVQADPIRAPARAQDLILRHRVKDYGAGDLQRRYSTLGVEEDFFVNYGFVTRPLHALMHPRTGLPSWSPARRKQAEALLEFVREHGAVHPRLVDDYFSHGKTKNYWGGESNATTHLLDALHYRGLLRVARRENGIRIYAPREPESTSAGESARDSDLDALVDTVVRIYAPLPRASLASLVGRLRYAVPQWHGELRNALRRAQQRLSSARVDGIDWYWPAEERVRTSDRPDEVRLLAPFDPIVWDRRRFELFWNWAYRFEAYTPASKRKLGYYALPLLWRDSVIGWGNISVADDALQANFGYVESEPASDGPFKCALEAEMARFRAFLGMRS